MNKVVNIECGEFDKYGRLLIKIQCDGEDCSVNQWLINKDYAFAYDGNAKKCWKEHLEEKNYKEFLLKQLDIKGLDYTLFNDLLRTILWKQIFNNDFKLIVE